MISELLQTLISWIQQKFETLTITEFPLSSEIGDHFLVSIADIKTLECSRKRNFRSVTFRIEYQPDLQSSEVLTVSRKVMDTFDADLQVLNFRQQSMPVIDKTISQDLEKKKIVIQFKLELRERLNLDNPMMRNYTFTGGMKDENE